MKLLKNLRRIAAPFLVVGGIAVGQHFALAQETSDKTKADAAKAKWESLTPEQQDKLKTQFKDKAKEKWESMTPEERESAKAKFKEKAKSRIDKMTPEERKDARERIRERRKARQSGS